MFVDWVELKNAQYTCTINVLVFLWRLSSLIYKVVIILPHHFCGSNEMTLVDVAIGTRFSKFLKFSNFLEQYF